jgi:hypothetical protein
MNSHSSFFIVCKKIYVFLREQFLLFDDEEKEVRYSCPADISKQVAAILKNV